MPRPGKGGRYHHGDLRAALIEAAIEVIAERGVRNFSLAEASRRLGVAVSAPYAHFADRDELLAAVAAHAWEIVSAELLPGLREIPDPAQRLAEMARGYVRFAAGRRPLFELLSQSGLDKGRYPEIETAERPVSEAFLACVRALSGGGAADADDLATAVEATAHGYAMLLLDDGLAPDETAVRLAADRAGRATLALVASRHLLGATGAAGHSP
jgi:AcrR family transcriptional regulator